MHKDGEQNASRDWTYSSDFFTKMSEVFNLMTNWLKSDFHHWIYKEFSPFFIFFHCPQWIFARFGASVPVSWMGGLRSRHAVDFKTGNSTFWSHHSMLDCSPIFKIPVFELLLKVCWGDMESYLWCKFHNFWIIPKHPKNPIKLRQPDQSFNVHREIESIADFFR